MTRRTMMLCGVLLGVMGLLVGCGQTASTPAPVTRSVAPKIDGTKFVLAEVLLPLCGVRDAFASVLHGLADHEDEEHRAQADQPGQPAATEQNVHPGGALLRGTDRRFHHARL